MSLIRKLSDNRNLLKNLVIRDLKHRYVGSMGGILWSAIHPIVQLLTYSFIFTVVLRQVPGDEYKDTSFTIFLFCGLVPWTFFSEAVLRSCSVLIDNTPLVTKTIIPVEILPITITLSTLVLHAISMVILFAVLLAFHTVPLSAIGFLFYLPMLLLLAQGLGWFFAALQVFLRDTVQVLQILLFLGWWLTPVMYSFGQLPERYRPIMRLNPMAVIVTGYRNSLLGIAPPDPMQITIAAGFSLAVFILGGLIFRKAKPAFADVL